MTRLFALTAWVATVDSLPTLDYLIAASIRTARALVIVAGFLVTVDALRVGATSVELPPHRPKTNALAWAIMGSVGMIVASSRLLQGDDHPAITLLLWAAIATALVIRASIRAVRPWFIWGSATLFGIIGLGFALVDVPVR